MRYNQDAQREEGKGGLTVVDIFIFLGTSSMYHSNSFSTLTSPVFVTCEPDQRRMVEIVGYLTKMRFGEQEQSKSKDTKEASLVRTGLGCN